LFDNTILRCFHAPHRNLTLKWIRLGYCVEHTIFLSPFDDPTVFFIVLGAQKPDYMFVFNYYFVGYRRCV